MRFQTWQQHGGRSEVLEYSPMGMEVIVPSLLMTDVAERAFQFQILGAIACVQHVLPSMMANHDGSILQTGGRSSLIPMSRIGSLSLAAAALRNYAYILNEELTKSGIYTGTVTICCRIYQDIADRIAALYLDMYQLRYRVEEVFGENIQIESCFPVRYSGTVGHF